MIRSLEGRRRRCIASAAAALFILTGCSGNSAAPAPASLGTPANEVVDSSPPVPAQQPSQHAVSKSLPPVMPASTPVSFRIPSIGAESKLLELGLRDDGSLEVPPEDPGSPAGWYGGSPTPGARGPAVLLGHVNATGGGPGVFANLRSLKAGDVIEVSRADGTTASFIYVHGEQYPKNAFPTQTVYGNTDGSELRIITCDGYDPVTGEFDDNFVAFARLDI